MENNNPFEGLPFFGDFEKLFGSGSKDHWSTAKQIAVQMASGEDGDPNVDPSDRIALEELSRIAQLHVSNATGLDSGNAIVVPVTRTQWAHETIDSYQPLFEKLNDSLGESSGNEIESSDPMGAMFGQMMQFLGPMMLAMTAGSMVGHLAQRALGQYDLPIPREKNAGVKVVTKNVEDFGGEWSLPSQELLLWVCLNELTYYTIFQLDHVRDRFGNLLMEYVSAFESNPSGLEEKLQQIDMTSPSAIEDLQKSLGSPEVILGAIQSEEQKYILPELEATTAVIVGYVDFVMDSVGHGLIGSYDQITEAMRRQRVEADPSDRFIERLLGLELTQAQVDRGTTFINGVIERTGTAELARLWEDSKNFPTPNEVDAPGLWLARLDLPE